MKAIEAYESAYPGSMFEHADGAFVRREDADSLAGALLALVKSGDRAAEDLQDELTEAKKDAARYRWLRERMLAADFDWNDSGECALVFAWPKDCAVSGNCDATIDAAMLNRPNV